ncbi:diaminobutyrate acetyltransferase [Nocardia testacea]|uniref:diaminobutyrate acetyltransferase n=1 Tax=Nocardia testacea TaxID=248551 RepID=UPI000A04490C|nr:diaminobutyrate acetyltransferase [Nocardia testacea]
MSLQTESTQTAGPAGNDSATSSAATDAEPASTGVVLRAPRITDAARLWQIADESQVLDVNSSYAYLLWCRDFAASSVVVESEGRVVGFVTGYVRPEAPGTLFVWQVAVDADQRGRGLGVAMLDWLVSTVTAPGHPAGGAVEALETTVSPDNPASIAMFASLARRRGAEMVRSELFEPDVFPDSHAAEDLYHISPIARKTERDHS